MAIGDDLLAGRNRFVGPMSFTPSMRAQGIGLSGVTAPATSLGRERRGFVQRPGGDPFSFQSRGNMNFGFIGPSEGIFGAGAAKGTMAPESFRQQFGTFFEDLEARQAGTPIDPGAGQRMAPRGQRGGGGVPMITPDDLRAVNPFDPSQKVVPEDDALTEEGALAPSELKETGGFFSKLGDLLSNPGVNKLLASVGMAMSPNNTVLGEFAINQAEQKAQRRFRQQLEAGQSPGDVITPGLSAQGRRLVAGDFAVEQEQAFQRERQAAQDTRAERRLEEVDIPQQERLSEMAGLQMRQIEQQIAQGEITTEMGQIELQAMRAMRESGAADPTMMFQEGARAIGLKVPEGLDLGGFSSQQVVGLLHERIMLGELMRSTGTRGSSDGGVELSEAARQVHIKSRGEHLGFLYQQLQGMTTSEPSRAALIQEIGQVQQGILELGGDPTEFTAASAPETGGTGLGRAQLIQRAAQMLQIRPDQLGESTDAELRQILGLAPLEGEGEEEPEPRATGLEGFKEFWKNILQ